MVGSMPWSHTRLSDTGVKKASASHSVALKVPLNKEQLAPQSPRQLLLVSGALLVLNVLCYGLRLPHLGFYWDDWAWIFTGSQFGAAGLQRTFESDRVALGWLYSWIYSLFSGVATSPL